MLSTSWKPGPAEMTGPVLISVTDFTSEHALDLPRIYQAGTRLARLWPDLQGAVGLRLWAEPLRRRTGAVSLWRGHQDLMGFVKLPAHVEIMRAFQDRGTVRSTTWTAQDPDQDEVWRRAMAFLDEDAADRSA
jgi:hypothetical protein